MAKQSNEIVADVTVIDTATDSRYVLLTCRVCGGHRAKRDARTVYYCAGCGGRTWDAADDTSCHCRRAVIHCVDCYEKRN